MQHNQLRDSNIFSGYCFDDKLLCIETLPPLARRGDIRRLIFILVGFPLILIGIGGIVYGRLFIS